MATRPLILGRFAALIAATLAMVMLSSGAMSASSRVCRQLEAELALASGGGRSATPSRKQEAAIARQQEQLQLAKRQARRSGCGFRLFGGSSNSCAGINRQIEKMEQNLAALERRRSRATGPASSRSRPQIMAALKSNGCRDEAVAERRRSGGREETRSLLDHIFGGGIRQRGSIEELGDPTLGRGEDRHVKRVPRSFEGGWVNDGGHIRYAAPPGTYRTLCVRTCDGYYFPMSGASSPSDFDRDQQNCRSSCPGAEVHIYYHRRGQESDSMVSGLSGQPYADLPTAWLYKQAGAPSPPGCSCRAPRNDEARDFTIIAGNPPRQEPAPSEPAMPYPTARPDPAADPETLANLDGGLDAETLRRMAVAPNVNKSKTAGEEKTIRVVGPVFLPDPEAATDPQAPARTPSR